MSANNFNNRINYNHLNSDLERNKRNRIDNETNKYYLNNGIYDKNQGNNPQYKKYKDNSSNNINGNPISEELYREYKEQEELIDKEFEDETKRAIEISLKEEKKRQLEEKNKKKEDKKLNINQMNGNNSESKNMPTNPNFVENNLINNSKEIKNQNIDNPKKSNNNSMTQENLNSNKNEKNNQKENNEYHKKEQEKENKFDEKNRNPINDNDTPKILSEKKSEIQKNITPKDKINSNVLNNNKNESDKMNNITKDNNNNLENNNLNLEQQKKDDKIINENPKTSRSKSVSKREEELLYVPLINPLQHNACYIHTSLHILFYCFDLSNYIIQLNNSNSINNNIVKSLIKMFVMYSKKSKEKTSISEEYRYLYNSIDTFNFRYELSEYSKIFLMYKMGDPIELIIYLLENCSKINSDLIHKLFYIDISEKYFCLKDKSIKEIKYDKDNFVREIYIEEILNFSNISQLSFDDFNNHLFTIFKDVSYQHVKKCDKCNLVMEKRTICNYLPKYFIINCVWGNKNPNKEDIINFYSMIQFNFNSIEMYDINTYKFYSFFGMILYCYYMCHYINFIYDEKKDIFILFSDELIMKFKTYNELINYLTGKDENDKYIFYPVLIIYYEIPVKSIKGNNLDKEYYKKLMKKISKTNNKENKLNTPNNDDLQNNGNGNSNLDNLNQKKEEERISIYEQMTNKIKNIAYYNELNKYHTESLKKNIQEKQLNSNEDLNQYSNNLKNERIKRSMSLEKDKYNTIQYERNSLNRFEQQNIEQSLNYIHRDGKTVRPNIQKNLKSHQKTISNTSHKKKPYIPELKSKYPTTDLNTFNKGSKNYNNQSNQFLYYTKRK